MSCLPLADLGVLSKDKFRDLVDSSKQRISQIASNIQQVASKTYEIVAENGTKVALAVGTSIMTLAPNDANAAGIAVAEGTGFTGSIDSIYYLTAVGIVVSFLGIAVAISLGIRALKKA